ncbi:MAG: Ig-like domain-containing protein [Thermoplasmatota archaeon]
MARLVCWGLMALLVAGALLPLVSQLAGAAYQGWLVSDSVDGDSLNAVDQTDWWDFYEVSGSYVAVAMVPNTDYDLRIYSATGGSGGGGAVLVTSSNAGSTPELCVCRCNTNNARSAEVFNPGAGGWNNIYRIEYQVSSSISVNSVYSNSMSTGDIVEAYTVSVQAGVPYTFRFTSVSSSSADFKFYVFNLNAGNWGTRASAIGGGSYTYGVSTPWSVTPAAAATYGVVVLNWNLASATYSFVAGAPDLVVSSLAISPSPVTCSGVSVVPQNRPYTYSVTVYNQGYSNAGAFTVTMYFDWAAVANWNLAGLSYRSSISSGGYTYSTASPDAHVLSAQADSSGTISEDGPAAEGNNWLSRTDAVAEVRGGYTNDADDTVPSANGYPYYFYAYYMSSGEKQKFALWNPAPATDFDMYLFSPTGTQLSSAVSASYPETLAHTATTNGYHYIEVVRATGAGTTFTFSPDDAAPTIQVVQPADGAYLRGNQELRLNCQDYGSGVTDTASNPVYRVDGGSWQDLSFTAQVGYNYVANLATGGLLDGGHTLEYIVWDNANNYQYIKQGFTSDNTAPSLCSLVSPTSGQFVDGVVTIKVSASDQIGLRGVDLTFGGNLAGLGTQAAALSGSSGYWEYQLSTEAYSDGGATVLPTARDKAGNALSQSATSFTIDNNPPSLSVTSPSDGDYVSGAAVTVAASASDAAGTVSVRYRIDGGAWRSMSLVGGAFTATWDTTGHEEGRHTITVRAIDGIGHNTDQELTVVVDNSDPTCSIVSPSAGQYVEGRFRFRAQAWDANGIASVKMTVAGVGTFAMTYSSTEDLYERELDTTLLSDASYSLSVEVTDSAAAHGLRPPVTLILGAPGFYIDNVPPTLALSSPSDQALVEGTVSLSVSSYDAPTAPQVEYSVDGIAWVSMTSGPGSSWTASWDTTKVVDGTHKVTFRARGQLGHVTALSISVVVDNNAPVCAVSAPADGQHIEGVYTLRVSAWDAVGVAGLILRVSNATTGFTRDLTPGFNPLTGYYEAALDTSTLWDGVFGVNATASDGHGHKTASPTIEFNVDNGAPSLSALEPSPEQYVSGDVSLRIQVADAFLALTAYSVDGGSPELLQGGSGSWDSRAVSDGRHTITFYATDRIGHVSLASVSVFVDNHEPRLYWAAPDEMAFLSGTFTIKVRAVDEVGIESVVLSLGGRDYPMTLNAGSGYYEYPLETSGLDGAWDITVTVKELAGQNRDNVSTRRVRIDNNAPVLSVHQPLQGAVLSGEVQLNYTAEDVHLMRVEYRVDSLGWFDASEAWNTSLHPDGPHTLTLRAVDMVGRSTEISFGLVVDNSEPSCAFIGPANDTFVSGVVILQLHSTDQAGLSAVALEGPGAQAPVLNQVSGLYEAVLDSRALADGSYLYIASVRDLVGREASAALHLKVDNHPPELSVLSPEDGAHLTGVLEVRADAVDAFATVVEYQLESMGWRPVDSTMDTSSVSDGPHELAVRATDEFGRSTTLHLTIHTDGTSPVVSILNPVAGGVAVSGELLISVAVEEEGGVSGVTYSVDGAAPLPMPMNRATGYYEARVSTQALSDDAGHRVTVNATSRAGLAASATREFRVDNSPPAVSVRSPGNADQKGDVKIVVEVSDATGVQSVMVRVDGGQWREMTASRMTGRYTHTYPTTLAQNGEHTFEIRVRDALGNEGSTVHSFKVRNDDWGPYILVLVVVLILVAVGVVMVRGRKKRREEEMAEMEPGPPPPPEEPPKAFPEMAPLAPPEPNEAPLVHVVLRDKRAESEAPAAETGPEAPPSPLEEITNSAGTPRPSGWEGMEAGGIRGTPPPSRGKGTTERLEERS